MNNNNSENKIKILMTMGDFELCTISKLVKEGDSKSYVYLPVKEGLTIKVREVVADTEFAQHTVFVPIAFIRPHKDGTAHYESYGNRIEKYCDTWDKVRDFRKVLAEGYDRIAEAIEDDKQ